MSEVSFLLGAGFSRPAGYPTAWELNSKITDLKLSDFYIDTSGVVVFEKNDTDPYDYSSYNSYKLFLLDVIKYYSKFYQFDYEKFFDFLKASKKRNHSLLGISFNVFFRKKHHIKYDFSTTMMNVLYTFNQIISHLITEADGLHFYKNEQLKKNEGAQYQQFLDLLEEIGKTDITHIHTLNHDILIDKLLNSEWTQGDYSDGFSSSDSPFFGNDGSQDIPLDQFINSFNRKFNLYKLHGGIDFVPYRKTDGSIDNYIKIKPSIHITNIFKRPVNDADESNDITHYHTDFLSGTSSKILRYNEPIYFQRIFNHFEANLRKSNKLIIIGYGCNDSEINKILISAFRKSSVFIMCPNPSDKIKKLGRSLKAKIIDKGIEDMNITDFD